MSPRVARPGVVADEIPGGPGIASLVIPMPGSVRVPSNTAATMITWLSAHGAPRTAEVLTRLQRHGWTVEVTDPDLARQCELRASARFAGVEQARAAVRPFRGRVGDQMRWMPADRAGEPISVSLTDGGADDHTGPEADRLGQPRFRESPPREEGS